MDPDYTIVLLTCCRPCHTTTPTTTSGTVVLSASQPRIWSLEHRFGHRSDQADDYASLLYSRQSDLPSPSIYNELNE